MRGLLQYTDPGTIRIAREWLMKHSLSTSSSVKLKGEISFGLGIASLICWAVAEIPQIITNFTNKSSTGVSLAFLSTWIVGDVFNLIGCMLEPSTLPTQFYTALLYTIVTIILALQCLYYMHFSGRTNPSSKTNPDRVRDERRVFLSKEEGLIKRPKLIAPTEESNFHFLSARSLAGSATPPFYCNMKAHSVPPSFGHHAGSSSEDEAEESTNVPPCCDEKLVSQPRPIPRPVKYGTFVTATANLAHVSWAFTAQEQELQENMYGQWLGWLMAAIYMGGRLPQIWLNIKRGSVEGLNPLMFVFALVANATYVGSILVLTTEWRAIRGNLPWLLDAIVCVALDLFIILQYVFYKFIKGNRSKNCGDYYEGYVEAEKPY